MGERRNGGSRKKQRQPDQRRRLKQRQQTSRPLAKQITPLLADQVDNAYDLIDAGDFAEAEQLLDRLDKRYGGSPAIVDARMYLYQSTGDHERCCQAAKRLAGLAPRDAGARLMYAQESMFCGRIAIALATCQLAPENRFAEATLGKLRFLSGQEDVANAIADRIVVNPPTQHDSLAAAIELLSFLGRDENVVVLSAAVPDGGIIDPHCLAMVLHHLAVAQFRLGDKRAARSSWKKCLKAMPTHFDARDNLADLDSGQGHAAWAGSLGKWIPQASWEAMLASATARGSTRCVELTRDYPAVAALLPALLDRGDPMGRELAFRIASADRSPAMLDALRQFALGSRGPDAMRFEALTIVGQEDWVDSGPHRFFSQGKWTEIKLFMPEIERERRPSASPRVRQLAETGTEALHKGDFELAEKSFERLLNEQPDDCSAAHNLCIVWLERDGEPGKRRAQARLEEIHARFPDYHFALISLAQLAAMDGDYDRAFDLLMPILDAKKLHISEAIALFVAQIQIAVKRRELDSAEQTLSLLIQFAGEDDPHVAGLRRLIDTAARGRRLSRLPSWVKDFFNNRTGVH